MAILVVAAHCKTPVVELAGNMVVATGMFAQAVHQQDHAAQRLARRQRPVLDGKVVTVESNKGGQRAFGIHQETWAMTWATAAVSFLA